MASDDKDEADEVDDEAETRKPPKVQAKVAKSQRTEPVADDDDADEADEGDEDEADRAADDDDDVDDEAETRKPPSVAAKKDEDDEDGDQAARVAEALGVSDDDEAPAGPAEDDAPQNRAARRREEARERRRKRRDGAKDIVATKAAKSPRADDDDAPKDRNVRAKELLLRRREQAAGGGRAVQSALLPGEMVDDALARTASAFSKWFRGNWNVIQWIIVGGAVVGGGLLFWNHRTQKQSGDASSALASAVSAERGRVMAEDKRSDEEKEFDPARVFKTPEERAEAAFASYKKVVDEHAGTGTAILAKLGLAGVHLDKKEYDQALAAYESVLATSLAGADPDVKGRSIEGIALAKEGKGDIDGALKSFKDLEGVDAKGYKELALYHQARLLLAKGDKEKAKELLKTAREKLAAPGIDGHPFQFLEAVVDETLRKIDPTAVPAKTSLSGPKGTQMTPEELEKLIKRAREAQEKKGGGEHDDH